MTFNNEYDLGDIISIVSIVLAIIGAAFGFYQWKKSIRIKRAEYIEKLTEKIRTDNDIKEMVYTLDYGHLWYTSAFHNSGELERKMDKTLSYFSYICYLYKSRLISKKECNYSEPPSNSQKPILLHKLTNNILHSISFDC